MKNIIPSCFCILTLAVSVFAQEESKIVRFEGGKIHTGFSLAGSLMSGFTGRASGLGGSISSFGTEPSCGFWNAASLASAKKYALQVDYAPPIYFDPGRLVDFDSEIQSSTDDAIQSYRDPTLLPTYSKLGTTIMQPDLLTSAVIVVPLEEATLSAYFHRPLDLSVQAAISGFHTKIKTQLAVGEEKDDVFFNSYVDGNLDLRLSANVIGLAAGKRMNEKWAVGLSFERFDFLIRSKGDLRVDGTMLFGGKENTFNDPNDNWHNDLNQALDAEYLGSDWGWKLSASYAVQPNLRLDAVFSWAPNVTTAGYLDLINNSVPALNLGGDGKDEILDPSKLKLSQLTLTREVQNKTFPKLEIKLPKTLTLAAAYRLGWFAMHFSYGLGLSPLSLAYGPDEIGLTPAHSFKLGLDFKYIQSGLGLLILKKVAHGSENLGDSGHSLLLPLFTLGTSSKVWQNYDLNFSLVVSPVPIFKMGIGYSF